MYRAKTMLDRAAGRSGCSPRGLLKLSKGPATVSCDNLNEPMVAAPDALTADLHLRWELQQVLSRVRPADLSTTEISSLLDVLIPAHSRILGERSSEPV